MEHLVLSTFLRLSTIVQIFNLVNNLFKREREREREKSSSLWQAKVTGDLINDFWAKISF